METKYLTYDLTLYGKVYVILKNTAAVLKYDEYTIDKAVRYDKKKEKHFVPGRLIAHLKLGLNNFLIGTMPDPKCIAILPEVYFTKYYRGWSERDKRAFVLEIPLKDIELITIMPESFSEEMPDLYGIRSHEKKN